MSSIGQKSKNVNVKIEANGTNALSEIAYIRRMLDAIEQEVKKGMNKETDYNYGYGWDMGYLGSKVRNAKLSLNDLEKDLSA